MSENKKDDNREQRKRAVRDQIQANMDAQMAERKRELFKQRLELARSGMDRFKSKDAAKSATNFHTYIKILEEYKGVPAGGLSPAHFDRKTESAEILLLSGIYWDLVKLYDKTKTAERNRDFAHYLQQFIRFSKDMPHQYVSSETLRRYIASKKAFHTVELKNAYRIINTSKCFVASALVEESHPDTVEILRDFRDRVLINRRVGRTLVAIYYRWARKGADRLDSAPKKMKIVMAKTLDLIAWSVELIQDRSDTTRPK